MPNESSPLSIQIQETERLLEEAERLLGGITPTPWAWESIAEKSNEFAVGQAFREDGTPIEGRIAPWMQKDGHYIEDVVIRAVVGMNESGHANFKDAEFIAAAPRIVRNLLAALTSQTQARTKAEESAALGNHRAKITEDNLIRWMRKHDALEQQLSTETQARVEAEQQRDLYLRSLKMLSESMAATHDSQSGE